MMYQSIEETFVLYDTLHISLSLLLHLALGERIFVWCYCIRLEAKEWIQVLLNFLAENKIECKKEWDLVKILEEELWKCRLEKKNMLNNIIGW